MDCPDGWAATGDFRVGADQACDISTIFVRVVYAIPVVLFPIAMIHSGRALVQMWRRTGWRAFMQMQNRVKTIHMTTVFASCFLVLAYLAKVVEPQRAIGIDPLVTWLCFLGMALFFVGLDSSFKLFVAISIKQEKFGGRKIIVKMLRAASYLIPMLNLNMCIAFMLVLVAVYVRDQSVSLAEELIANFWRLLAISAVVLLVTVPFILHAACRDLAAMIRRNQESSGKIKDLEDLLVKFRGVRRQALTRGLVNSAFFLTLGISPTVRYWSPYLIGVQALLFSIVVLGLATLTSRKASGSSQQASQNSSKVSSKASKATLNRLGSKVSLGGGSKEGSKEEADSKTNRSSKDDVVVVSPGDIFEPPTPTGNTPGAFTTKDHQNAYMFG